MIYIFQKHNENILFVSIYYFFGFTIYCFTFHYDRFDMDIIVKVLLIAIYLLSCRFLASNFANLIYKLYNQIKQKAIFINWITTKHHCDCYCSNSMESTWNSFFYRKINRFSKLRHKCTLTCSNHYEKI